VPTARSATPMAAGTHVVGSILDTRTAISGALRVELAGPRGVEGGPRQGGAARGDTDVLNGFRLRQIAVASLLRAPIPDRSGG
jgi:hypothetical protein